MMIAIIDYGMGNLRSVEKALIFLGFEAEITDSPRKLSGADKIILPGVGAFSHAMDALREKGLDAKIKEEARRGKPILGICLGMQLLFDKSFENGVFGGLGLLPGAIVRLPAGVKAPHVGWNSIDIKKREPLFTGLSENPFVYFVHSYHLKTDAPIVAATAFYGGDIQVAAQMGNIFALQFHPEKSGDEGLEILKNFGRL